MTNKTVIEGSSVSASQRKELFGQIASGALNGGHLQALIEHRNPFASRIAENLFYPAAYFKTRQGLWVLDSFEKCILAMQPAGIPQRGLDGVTSQMLQRKMSDKEIIDELLGGMEEAHKYAFTPDQIATVIDLQPNGEDGALLYNGCANIFYVLVMEVLFAFSVSWNSNSDYLRWNVSAWSLGERPSWGTGYRVFRNTTLEI